jgi:hypothetical protein
MPSYCRFEGLNLLTVYFCYRKDNRRLWIVVLEVRIQLASPTFEASPCMTLQIHNTFGERHVSHSFDHQWSFPPVSVTCAVSPFSHSDPDIGLAAYSSSSIQHNERAQILGIPARETRFPIQDTRTRRTRGSPIHPLSHPPTYPSPSCRAALPPPP